VWAYDLETLRFLEVNAAAQAQYGWTGAEFLANQITLGVHIAVDDFGSGYASFGYFRQYPIDSLKIDRSFIGGLGIEREATAIVDAAVQLARGLGILVTGEGIENEAQAAALAKLDCDLGQGYLFARPPAAEGVTELFTAQAALTPA
jgi:EAL domain-containing protein (putative c-di-GMP-specific phosphodiesterase class I)